MKSALLLSGGMDSCAVAYWLRPELLLTVDYGQLPAEAEIASSKKIAKTLGIYHEVLNIDLSCLGSGDLAGKPPAESAPESDWWPFRNQTLITLAAMRLISSDIKKLLVATVATDNQHADGSEPFMTQLADLIYMQEGEIILQVPAINFTTAELIKKSACPQELLGWTHSCHVSNVACGQCRGCVKHRDVVKELGYV